jgi:type II secretion system protein I
MTRRKLSMNTRNVQRKFDRPARAAAERGFTLIETMIALVLMMIVGLGVISLFAYTINSNAGTGDRAAALAIAQQYMERLRSSSFAEVTSENGTPADLVESAGRKYRVETTVCTTADCGGSSTLKRITVQVTPVGGASKWAITPVTVTALRATLTKGGYMQ